MVKQCSCNRDWLHNETIESINKWLNTTQGTNQLRLALLMSSSNGATSGADFANRLYHISPNSSSSPTLRPSTIKTSSSSASWLSGSRNNKSSANISVSGLNWYTSPTVSNQRRRFQSPQPISFTASSLRQSARTATIAGPRGPKGDQGLRGERGESGLTSVKDREALFQLETQIGKMIFVELEQLLVLGTTSGWRPLMMAAQPLRDFKRLSMNDPKLTLSSSSSMKWITQTNQPGSTQVISSSIDSDSRNNIIIADTEDNDEDDDDGDEDGDEGDDADSLDTGDDEEDEDDDEDNVDKDNEHRLSQINSKPIKHTMTTFQPKSSATLELPSSNRKSSFASRREAANNDKQSFIRPKLRIAALNEPYSGNLRGIRGIDLECKRQAARANIKGSFRSFLATGSQNLADLVRPNAAHKSSIVNLRGEQLAESWTSLLRQPTKLTNPLSRLYSFDGRHVASDSNWPNKLIWHGSQSKYGLRDLANNCDSWHSDTINKFGSASPIHNPKHYTNQHLSKDHHPSDKSTRKSRRYLMANNDHDNNSTMFLEPIDKYPCRMPLIVLCIETIAQTSVSQINRDQQPMNLIDNHIEQYNSNW